MLEYFTIITFLNLFRRANVGILFDSNIGCVRLLRILLIVIIVVTGLPLDVIILSLVLLLMMMVVNIDKFDVIVGAHRL